MSPKTRKRVLLATGMLTLLLTAGIATAVLWPKPPPPKPVAHDNDTGHTRQETEQMMREIGYVQ